MNLVMRRGVLLVSALTASLLLAGCGGVSRRAYVARNEAIVASLPVLPGAVKTHEVSTPYVESEGGLSTKPSGYMTTVVYRVPRATTAASVLHFYETRLGRRGWDSCAIASGAPVANLTRSGALVAVNAAFPAHVQGEPVARTYELLVDYRGAGRC